MVDAAHELGLVLFVANCDPARSRSARCCAPSLKAADFEYFGGNSDALYDCLCDTVLDHKTGVVLWLYKLHSGDPALEEDAARIDVRRRRRICPREWPQLCVCGGARGQTPGSGTRRGRRALWRE